MNFKKKVRLLSEANSKKIDVYQHTNPYLFNDIKRIFRELKRKETDANKEYPKSFFKDQILKEIDKKQKERRDKGEKGVAKLGTDAIRNKILDSVFKDNQKMKVADFEDGLMDYAENYPLGEKIGLGKETDYQTTQRLMPSDSKNKTLSAVAFSGFLSQMKEDFKNEPKFDEAFRAVDAKLQGHFENSTSFVRYTNMGNGWLHFDAFQTDFFNKLGALRYKTKKSESLTDLDKVVLDIISYLLGKTNEIFKSAVSYTVMQNKDAKQFTAPTSQMIQQVERVSGEGKIRELYDKLPKQLGFEKKKLSEIMKIMDLRPGKKTDKLKQVFGNAISKLKNPVEIDDVNEVVKEITPKLSNKKDLKKAQVDEIINNSTNDNGVKKVLHSLLDEITKASNENKVKEYFKNSNDKIKETIKKINSLGGGGSDPLVWWSTRGLILENNEVEIGDDIKRVFLEVLGL